MKENKLSKEEIRELEEMSRVGKEVFSGDLDKVEQMISGRIDELDIPQVVDKTSASITKWGLVLLLLISIALAVYFFGSSNQSTETPIHYATAYYETPPFVISQDSRGEVQSSTILSEVNDAYKRKDFSKVLTLTENQKKEGLMFYRGIAHYELGQTKEAINVLKQDDTKDLEDMRSWYLALGYLQSNDTQSAQTELEKIVTMPDHYKLSEASDLLRKISK